MIDAVMVSIDEAGNVSEHLIVVTTSCADCQNGCIKCDPFYGDNDGSNNAQSF